MYPSFNNKLLRYLKMSLMNCQYLMRKWKAWAVYVDKSEDSCWYQGFFFSVGVSTWAFLVHCTEYRLSWKYFISYEFQFTCYGIICFSVFVKCQNQRNQITGFSLNRQVWGSIIKKRWVFIWYTLRYSCAGIVHWDVLLFLLRKQIKKTACIFFFLLISKIKNDSKQQISV